VAAYKGRGGQVKAIVRKGEGICVKRGIFWIKLIAVSAVMLLLGGCAIGEETVGEEAALKAVTFYGVKDPQISLMQILADKLGYFEEEGLRLQNIYLPTVQDLAPLMVNGQAEIACATNYSAAVWSMNGADIKIVAPTANIGGTQCILINSDIELTKPKDLEGLRIGLLSGSTQQLVFMRMCKELQLDKDSFSIVPLQFAEQLTAISEGQVDMIATTEPWITKTGSVMDVTVLCSGIESYIPGAEGEVNWCNTYSCIVVQRKWLEDNKEDLQKLIRAIDRAVAYVDDNREAAIQILAEELELTADEMKGMMKNNRYGVNVDDTYLSTSLELFHYITEENMINNQNNIEPKDYHDFSILKETLPNNCRVSVDFDKQ